jgi:hypothetical protein
LRLFVRRNTKPDTGSRQSGQEPEPMAKAKDRAPKAMALGLQVRVRNFFNSKHALCLRRHSDYRKTHRAQCADLANS